MFNEKAVDWQEWIFAAYPKGGASSKNSYAVCMVGSLRYYSFLVFKQQLDAQYLIIPSTVAIRVWKSSNDTVMGGHILPYPKDGLVQPKHILRA